MDEPKVTTKSPSKREKGESEGEGVIMEAEIVVMQDHGPRNFGTSRC